MRISDQKKEQISRLIAAGENLDPEDLDVFYQWINASYKTLAFHRTLQGWFDECCRSSCDSINMRAYVGVWILRMSLRDF